MKDIRNLLKPVHALAASAVLVVALAVGGCTQTTAPADGSAAGSAVQQAGSAAVTADDAQIAVQVVVDSSAADGSVSFDGTVELAEDAAVLDALKATGLTLDVQDSEYGAFVNAINDLGTGDFGDSSGWGYDVNGEMIMDSADTAKLADGDVVTWTYLV